MKTLITKADIIIESEYVNKITKILDEKLNTPYHLYAYLYKEKFNNKYPLRHVGQTIGYVEVDENEVIKDIVLYEQDILYNHKYQETVDQINEYIGYQLVFQE